MSADQEKIRRLIDLSNALISAVEHITEAIGFDDDAVVFLMLDENDQPEQAIPLSVMLSNARQTIREVS